jgi:hypothetical protein
MLLIQQYLNLMIIFLLAHFSVGGVGLDLGLGVGGVLDDLLFLLLNRLLAAPRPLQLATLKIGCEHHLASGLALGVQVLLVFVADVLAGLRLKLLLIWHHN